MLGIDCRRRHHHRRIGKWIVEFSVQLEIFVNNRWFPVLRYDTAHGFFHRHRFFPDGKEEKVAIDISQLNDALTFAENDIKVNWKIYREKFLEEKEAKND